MPRRQEIPEQLEQGPITVRDAERVGVAQARRVVELVEPGVESPMESRLRMILVPGGLPRPQVQVDLRDASGRFLARPDLLCARARLRAQLRCARPVSPRGAPDTGARFVSSLEQAT